MARHRQPADPEAEAVLAELAAAARAYAAAGDPASVREMGYVLTTMASIREYGYDGLERIRARRYLRRAGRARGSGADGCPLSLCRGTM